MPGHETLPVSHFISTCHMYTHDEIQCSCMIFNTLDVHELYERERAKILLNPKMVLLQLCRI